MLIADVEAAQDATIDLTAPDSTSLTVHQSFRPSMLGFNVRAQCVRFH